MGKVEEKESRWGEGKKRTEREIMVLMEIKERNGELGKKAEDGKR